MFMEPDHLCLIVLEVAAVRWVNCGHTEAHILTESVAFQTVLDRNERPNVCRENIPHTITPPAV